jgi:hypothetical protein
MILALLLCSSLSRVRPEAYFGIHIVDEATGRGVPLAQLETVNKQRFISDSNGFVAFNEPGLMERRVFFSISSPGYQFPKDGFGYAGTTLLTHAGHIETIKLKRLNIAERLCRLTGQGIYRDSELLGQKTPISQPVLNGGVLGQDTAQAEIYKGQMFWFWGDTDRPDYPLGNFHTTGAIASLPHGKTDASAGIEFRYFQDGHGFVKPMVPSPDPHPIWVSGVTVLGSGAGQEMFAYYAEMQNLGSILKSGYLKWSDSRQEFEPVKQFSSVTGWRFMDNHTIRVNEEGSTYTVGGFPPTVRVPADEKHLLDPAAYEAFTCVNQLGTVMKNAEGAPAYQWQKLSPPISPKQEQELVAKGQLAQNQAHFLPMDSQGKVIFPHGGSVHWNDFRHKWIAIFTRLHGADSELGEIYYSEADSPTGPFKRATKICTHGNYTFYNPVQHPFLDRNRGRTVYFEGTYTAEFSGNKNPTPRYNYNQLLYRLDLSDPRLAFAETNN